MALTRTARGSGTNNASANPLNVSPSGNFAAGSWGVLVVTADNNSTQGATNDFAATLTDSLGNVWTLRQAPIFDNGAAAAGIQGAQYTSDCAAGAPQTSTTIPISTGVAAVAKGWSLYEIIPGAGKIIKYISGGVNTGATTGTPTVTTGTIRVGDLVVGAYHSENVAVLTGDADATNGSWDALVSVTVGSTTSGIRHGTQTKLQTTADSTQTFNPTASSQDCILSWIQLREGTVVSSSITVDAVLRKAQSSSLTANAVLRKQRVAGTGGGSPAGSWTSNPHGSTDFLGVAYGNGWWAALTTAGRLYTTRDPASPWTLHATIFNATTPTAISFADGRFWIESGNYYATDPSGTWVRNDLGINSIAQMHHDGTRFGGNGGQFSNAFNYGTDPYTGSFAAQSLNAGAFERWLGNRMAIGGGYWIGVGNDSSTPFHGVWYSPNPSTTAWVLNELGGANGNNNFNSVEYGSDGYFVKVGNAGGVGYVATDPTLTWTTTAVGSSNINDVAHDGAYWVIVGVAGYLRYTANPSTGWIDNQQGSNQWNGIAGNGSYWVVVGAAGALRYLYVGSFALDAVLRRTQSGSVTFDAVIGAVAVTRTGSFTVDSVLRKSQSASFVADSVIRRTQTGSFTADAMIAYHFAIDAVLKRTQARSFTADARLRAPQKGHVTHQITNSIWYDQTGGTTDIFLSIDEETPDDADYIRTDDNPTAATYEANVAPLEDPLSSSGHVMRVRHLKTGSRAATVTATLYQESGDIASFPVTPTEDVAATDSYTLSGAEADAIVDYTRLKIRFVGATTGGGSQTQLRVTWFEFEVVGATTDTHVSAFLADAVVRKTQAGSLAADAIVRRTQLATLTSDAIIRKTQAAALTTDAVVRAVLSGTFTADAVTRVSRAASFTADAIARRTQPSTLTADAVVRAQTTGSFTLSAWILGSGVSPLTLDAIVRRTQVASVTADAVLKRTQTGQIAVEAIVNRTASATFTADAVLRAVSVGSITVDAVVRKTVLAALTADAVVRQTRMAGFATDAILRSVGTGSLTLQSVIRTVRTGVLTADATVRRTQSATLTTDAILRRNQTGLLTFDAVIAIGAGGGSFAVDAVVRRTQAHALTVDAVVRVTRAASFVADALLRRISTGTITADAVLRRTHSGSLTANSILRSSQTGSTVLDSILRLERTGSFSLDAVLTPLVTVERTGSFTIGAVIRVAHPPVAADIEATIWSADIEAETAVWSADIEADIYSSVDEAGGIALSDVSFTEGDSFPPLTGTIKNAAKTAAIPLTDIVSIRLQMRRVGDRRYTVDAEGEVTDAATGRVRYAWGTNDLDRPGEYEVQWELHRTDGSVTTTQPVNTLTVREQ